MAEQQRRSVDERREQLIDAAIAVLSTEGLAATTTRRVTDEAGVALGAFHYAFANKDELLRSVIERVSQRSEQALADAARAAGSDPVAAAEKLVHDYWQFVESTPELQLAQQELTVHALRDPGLRDLVKLRYDRLVAVLAPVVDTAVDADGTSSEDLARCVVATLDGLALHHTVQADPAAARRRLPACVAALRALLGAGEKVRSARPS